MIITYWLQAMAKLRILKHIQPKTQLEGIQYLLQNLLGFQLLAALENNGVNEETTQSFFLSQGLAQQVVTKLTSSIQENINP